MISRRTSPTPARRADRSAPAHPRDKARGACGRRSGELEKVAVQLYPRHGELPEGSTERDSITITFERRDVEDLIRGMRECSAELLQYAK